MMMNETNDANEISLYSFYQVIPKVTYKREI